MFTGIVEAVGRVAKVQRGGTNKTFWIQSPLSAQLRPDQSVAHDGVCLTVEEITPAAHRVTAVAETLQKTALNDWEQGNAVNLERSLLLNSRLDGHFVQGHVDTRGCCEKIENRDGSYEIRFSFPPSFADLIIEKGSVAVNGISLTAFNVTKAGFSVAVIPYTWEHTNLSILKEGQAVNLEFDLIGKYVLRQAALKS